MGLCADLDMGLPGWRKRGSVLSCAVQKTDGAFSVVEMVIVLGLAALLAVLGIGAGSRALATADRMDATTRLKSLGQAVFHHAAEHEQRLPGPLWPGQVLLYDAQREGRLVRELADYLDIETRATPYVVDRMFPRAYRRAMPPGSPGDARVYVMNSGLIVDGQVRAPFGSLTTAPVVEPMRLGQLPNLPSGERWMISEADQSHPDVAGAPWKTHTPPQPLHEGHRISVGFDGSVSLDRAE